MYDDAYLHAVAVAAEPATASEITGVPDAASLAPGVVLAGKYRVERVLGAGGMGVVVAARHIHLDAPVALKFMTQEALTHRALVTRFLREARATARLRGEHVIRVSDVGELESGAPYMVMEHLQGQDLAALLASLGPPPIASAVEYAIQACEGLDEAHRAGIVHRDIKPSNLFLTRRPNGSPCIKLLDFGISKSVRMLHATEFLHSTSDHAIFGTPLYMAPEQMRASRDVDGRADLWSLGASLYELLSGTVPFPADSIVGLAYRIANEVPPPLRAKRPEIPEGLERIVMRCLERDCERRFPDARALAVALDPYRTHGGADSLREGSEDEDKTVIDESLIAPPLSTIPPDESLATSSVSWGRSQRPPAFARRRKQAIAAAGVLVACVGVVVGLTRRERPLVVGSAATPASTPPAASPARSANVLETVTLPPLSDSTPSAEPPTVSVTDLPSVVLRPAFVPLAMPTAAVSAALPIAPVTGTVTGSATVVPKADPDGILSVPPAFTGSKAAAPRVPTIHTDVANCSPPYFFDELGLKIFKPECVN